MTLKEAIETLRHDRAMILFDPMTGENKDVESLNHEDKDSYNALTLVINELEHEQGYRNWCRLVVSKNVTRKYKPKEKEITLKWLRREVKNKKARKSRYCNYV